MIARITGFIIFLTLISYLQLRKILTNEGKKEAIAYIVLMVPAAIIGSLLLAGVDIPSPNIFITNIFEPIGKAVLGK